MDDTDGVSRRELLLEAAAAMDRARSHLAPGQPVSETPEGKLARALTGDTVEFAGYPVWYRITDKDFLTRKLSVPIRFKELARRFNFFWMYAPVALFPQRHWAFNRLDVILEFNATESQPERRPKAYQILPEKKFQQLVGLTDRLEVSLNENFEFSAAANTRGIVTPPVQARIGAGVDAKAAGGMGLVVGPFTYRIMNAKIDHTPVGMEMVRWRIEGAEFFQENSPELIVIVQVPIETEIIEVSAALEARRYFSYAAAGLQEAVRQLADKLRRFFEDGLPLKHQTSWTFPSAG